MGSTLYFSHLLQVNIYTIGPIKYEADIYAEGPIKLKYEDDINIIFVYFYIVLTHIVLPL